MRCLRVGRPGATFDHVPPSEEVFSRARALADICSEHGIPLAAAALQFPLRHLYRLGEQRR